MYIKKVLYSGIDYSDSKTQITQMSWNGNYDIPMSKVTDCIAADMINEFPYLDAFDIYHAILSKQRFTFPIPYIENEQVFFPEQYHDEYEMMGEIQGYDFEKSYYFGQASSYMTYCVEDIPKEQVCYLPEEQFYAYYKGVSLIQRFFHEPFRELQEAETYLASMKKHAPNSKCVLLVHNFSYLEQTTWYHSNLKALQLMQSVSCEEIFVPEVRRHIERLQKLARTANKKTSP